MFKTRFISMLVLLAAVATGAWAEDYYNVTFSGFDVPALNTTVTTTLPKDFTAGEQGHKFSAWNIYDDGNTLSNVTVSGGNGKVSSSIYNDDFLKITVSGAFDGNATIHVSGVRDGGGGFEADITVTCVSANEAFDVTYDANGGSGAPSAQEKRKDTDLTLSSDVPTRTGYTFAGWNTAQDGSGDSYAPGATYTANADVTLYAQWTAPAASTYTVTLKDGTDDATSWTIAPAEATTTGVAAGTTVTATYGGVKKVKSVKAVKKAKPAATVTTAPTAKTGVKAGEDVAIVNEGTAEGGTMMYMVNATQPASTDGFSATVPTAEGLTAGTYYVWYYVKADDSHTDSEISASGIEVTIEAAAPALNLTSLAVGQVIGDDGKNYDYASLPGGVTAVAKICYVSGSNGLALALADEGQMDWSTAISTCAAHTPAFTGGTWKLATKDEWTNMITAAGNYTDLRTGFSSVGGSNLQSDLYWSSTEYKSNFAWGYDFYYEYGDNFGKVENYRVRACLAF